MFLATVAAEAVLDRLAPADVVLVGSGRVIDPGRHAIVSFYDSKPIAVEARTGVHDLIPSVALVYLVESGDSVRDGA